MAGMVDLALSYCAGECKLEDIPQGIRKHVQRIAQGMSAEQFKALASSRRRGSVGQVPRLRRGQPVRIRAARSF